jgi:hypothetical protein
LLIDLDPRLAPTAARYLNAEAASPLPAIPGR